MSGNKLFGAIAILGLAAAVVFGSTTGASALTLASLLAAQPRSISAQGGSIDDNGDIGSIGVAGIINFNNSGGASAVNLTITYQDSDVETPKVGPPSAVDGFYCVLTTPSDVSYTLNGPSVGLGTSTGTLTLTVGAADTCYHAPGGDPFKQINPTFNEGNSLNFNLYVTASLLQITGRVVATTSTLYDANFDDIQATSVTGTLQ